MRSGWDVGAVQYLAPIPCLGLPQASQAARTLQRHVAAESAAIVAFFDVYHATVTAHQAVRGKLAAWPDYIQPFRLMQFLGAR